MTMRESCLLIDETAADWASRIEGAPLSPADQALLETWLAQDSRHLGAFARARAVIQQIKSARGLGGNLAHGPILDRLGRKKRTAEASRRQFLRWGGGLAASLGAGLAAYHWHEQGKDFATRRGEIRLVPLTDGSSVTLNTASRIKVAFSGENRVIHLLEGEALFNIVDARTKAFLVQAGDTLVSAALGQFSVSRIVGEPVKILVQAGVVEVGRPGGHAPLRLRSNSLVDMSASGPHVHDLSPADLTRALAWREGMLSFADLPLDQAAAQFARYSDLHIILDDNALRHETVTGLFAATDPQGFVQAVTGLLNLRSRKEADGLHLSRS